MPTTPAEPVFTDNPAQSRFEAHIDGELAGFMDYVLDGGQYAIPYTRVFPQFGGRGLGGRLVAAALTEIDARGGTVVPICPFVPKVIDEHPEFAHLVK